MPRKKKNKELFEQEQDSEEIQERSLEIDGQAQKPDPEEGQKGKELSDSRHGSAWHCFMILLLFIGMGAMSAALFAAWTTWHTGDLTEPFVCSYMESDMHAREVEEAFYNLVERAETIKRVTDSFYAGNIDYSYSIKIDTGEDEILKTNLNYLSDRVEDINIQKMAKLKTWEGNDPTEHNENMLYNDCYWWSADSDPEVIYSGLEKTRVEVPQILKNSRIVQQLGICFSNGVLREKQAEWQQYVNFIYLMTGMLAIGILFVLYAAVQLICHGTFPKALRSRFLEIPYIMILLSILALYACYERRIALFSAHSYMQLLASRAGQVQMAVDIFLGAIIILVCLMAVFISIWMLAAGAMEKKEKGQMAFHSIFCWRRKTNGQKAGSFLKKQKSILHHLLSVVCGGLKVFWGFFTGKSLQQGTIARRERRRGLIAMISVFLCGGMTIYGAWKHFSYLTECSVSADLSSISSDSVELISLKSADIFQNGIFMKLSAALLLLVILAYILGGIYNALDYGNLENMLDEVYGGGYQGISAQAAGLKTWSVCYEDARKLERISSGFQKAVEEQIHAERMKIELLTNVSHDLKTPLTSIISYVELLSMEELPAAAEDYVQILKKKAERLKTIISEVFDLAKATSGEMEIEKKEIDFYRLVEQTLGDMQDKINESNMQVKEKFAAQSVMIFSDGEHLYRVLQNLFDNALKSSMKGTRIYLELETDGEMLTFTIKNIAGYEMDFEAGDITERFVRGDKNRTTEGSGLGLSIAQGFTIACGGQFQVIVDGDMFKVQLKFPVLTKTKEELSTNLLDS